jgi:pathogenesis-related protein 1
MAPVLLRIVLLLGCAWVAGVGACGGTSSAQSASPSRPAGDRARPLSAQERQTAVLRAHNQQRAKHCAPALRWSDQLARTAQRWAVQIAKDGCKLKHSGARFGENLAAGTIGAFSPEEIVQMWYREIAQYKFERGGFSMKTGHFTQLVWRATREVGCGMSQCNGLDVWVCNYDPPGNVEGGFRAEVLPRSCRK